MMEKTLLRKAFALGLLSLLSGSTTFADPDLGSQLSCVEGGPLYRTLKGSRNQLRNSAAIGNENWTDEEFLSGIDYIRSRSDGYIGVSALTAMGHAGFGMVAWRSPSTFAKLFVRLNIVGAVVSTGAIGLEYGRRESAKRTVDGISLILPGYGDTPTTFSRIAAEIDGVVENWNSQSAEWRVRNGHLVIRELNSLSSTASQFARRARQLYEDQIHTDVEINLPGLDQEQNEFVARQVDRVAIRSFRFDQIERLEATVGTLNSDIEKAKNEIAAESYILSQIYCGLENTNAWVDGNEKELGEVVATFSQLAVRLTETGEDGTSTSATTQNDDVDLSPLFPLVAPDLIK